MTDAPHIRAFVREILYDVIRWGDVSHLDALDSAERCGLLTLSWDGDVRSVEPGEWWVEARGGIRRYAAALVGAIVEGEDLQADHWHEKAVDYGVIVQEGAPAEEGGEGEVTYVMAPHLLPVGK